MKNNQNNKHKNVLFIISTQGIAKMRSLAVVLGLFTLVNRPFNVLRRVVTGHQNGSTSRARALNLFGAFVRLTNQFIAGLTSRARLLSQLWTGSVNQIRRIGLTSRARLLSRFGVFEILGHRASSTSRARALNLLGVFSITNTLIRLVSSTSRARLSSLLDVLNKQGLRTSSTSRARLSSLFGALPFIGHRASSTSRARALNLLGVLVVTIAAVAGVVANQPAPAQAATSNQLNFQGRLLTNTGGLVPDGDYNIEFNLYYVPTAGTSQWTETRLVSGTGVTVRNGYFSVYLGDQTPFPALDWSQDLYLGMTIRGTTSCAWGSCTPADSEMTPRFKLTSVPYAFRAANVASSDVDSTNSDNVDITTGDATTSGNSGNINIDTGVGATANGTINLGSTNASALTLGRTGVTTTNAGALSVTQALSTGSTLGVTGLATFDGNIRISDGSSNYATIAAQSTAGDYTYTIPTTAANDTFCLVTLANCGTTGAFVQNGNSFTATAVLGTNDAFGLNLETNNTVAVSIDASQNTTFNGGVTIATGSTFTNASSTLLSAISISDVAGGGDIGLATATVDVATTFDVNQTTAAQTLTLPSPTVTTSGRIAYVNNVGSAQFTMYGSPVAAGSSASFIWNGTSWVQTISFSSTGVDTIGALDGQAATANGATIVGTSIYLQSASATAVGLVNTSAQSFAGDKTFTNAVSVTGLTTLNGDLTIQAGDTLTFNGDAFTDFTGGGLVNSSGVLTVDVTSATGFFQNGGNSFGTGAILGTNDNNSLVLRTNSTAALTIDTSQNAIFAGTLAVTTLGTADTSTYLCRNSSNIISGCLVSPISSTLADNVTDAFDLQEGTNNYININTTDTSENISFGNATTNPSYNFLGTGALTISGATNINGNTTLGDASTDTTTIRGQVTLSDSSGTYPLIFGADTNLYRGGADLLVTDDSLTVSQDLGVNGGDIVTSQTTFNLINTTATTLNIGGAATSLNLGAGTGTTTVNNTLTVTGLTTLNGGLTVEAGDTFTFNGDAFTDFTGGGLYNNSGVLSVDTTTSGSGFFQDGGNSFSGTATLGTNDANILSLETTNTSRFQIAAGASTLTGQGATTLTSTGTLTVSSAAASALTIDSGTTGAINLGTSANAKTITIGNGTGATSLVLNAGTGAINIGTNAVARTTTIGNTTGASALTLNSGTGAINIGTGAQARTINVGTGAAVVQTINIGGTGANVIGLGNTQTGGSISIGAALTTGTINVGGTGAQTGAINLGVGTGAQTISLGTGAGAKTTVLGSTNTTSATTIQSGSGGISLSGATTATGTLTVTGLTTLNGGLTVEAGDTFTFNGDAFTDFTGGGLYNNSGVLSVDTTTSGSGFFQDGGNSFSGTATLGTNDAFGLQLKTNNATRLTVTSAGNVGIGTATPITKLDVAGSTRITGTGTTVLTGSIDPDGTTTATGVGTLFTTELVVGDRITVSGETRTVTAIASDTSLTVDIAFANNANDISVDRLPAIITAFDSSNNLNFIIQDNGNVAIGATPRATDSALYVYADATMTNTLSLKGDHLWAGANTNYYNSNNDLLGIGLNGPNLDSASAFIWTYGANDFKIGTNGTERLRVTSAGATSITGSLTVAGVTSLNGGLTVGESSVADGTIALFNSTNAFDVTISAANQTVGSAIVSLPDTLGVADTFCLATVNNCNNSNAFVNGGNSFTALAVLGTNDAYDLQLEVAGNTVATFANSNGSATFQNSTDSANAFSILSSAGGAYSGSTILSVDTANYAVKVSSTVYKTVSNATCAVNCTITQANIDTNAAIIIEATAEGLDITLPDPTDTTAGRLVYITAANGSEDFTLIANTGGGLGVEQQIAMRQNTTATMIWDGANWTAAGASSSTTLQAAYDNTLTAAGGAEIILNNSASSNGLTVRNNATNPIIGEIFEAQTSIGSNLFSVNNNAIEYATNGGAETVGASPSTFPASTWGATPDGGTVSRYTTIGDYVATGQASVSVVTAATANQGAANTLNTALTPNLRYSVSFAIRGTSSVSTLGIYYSPDGTNTGTVACAIGQTITQGAWTRINCYFDAPASGITSSNAIFIRQSDATARTYYIENLSVTVKADVNHAADGSVDDSGSFATNWTAAPVGGTVVRDTTIIYDTSGAAKVTTTATIGHGIRNNLSITPTINTQYLVTFYARSSNTFNDIRVRYSRDGGTNFVSCVDYNTQDVSTVSWTRITCLLTTDGTAPSNGDLIIDQPTAIARDFYVDALSVTLNTNTASNVKIGGGALGGPTTLLTLDRSAGPPVAANNDAYLGSMYYDTTTGRIQCYESGGWGTCGAPPDNIVNLNPEYAGSVLNGTGVGTMQADVCANETGVLLVNSSLCASGQALNYYQWTSPQATQQTYSIYVTYQLPSTFDGFSSDDTVQLTGRVDNTTNAAVTYEMFKSQGGTLTKCGTGETTVASTANTWQTVGINGNESTGCSFTSASANGFVLFKINLKANSNANAYVSTLTFTTTGR